jgi:SAM-dependent methyltransferase
VRCRICHGEDLEPFLDLGPQPLANGLISPSTLSRGWYEPRYPLVLAQCTRCTLVQLTYVVPGEVLFRDYFYFSSVSKAMSEHFALYAEEVARRFVPDGGLVVEIGSNDGVLLRSLLDRPVRILGVDPALNVAEVARAQGVPTLAEFFGEPVARTIVAEHGPAAAIIANNVFAHIDDLDSVMRGVDALLAADGVFVMEVPYLVDLVEHIEFDTVYHEHLSYFSLRPLLHLFGRFGFEMFDVSRQTVHGGTVRVFVRRRLRAANGAPQADEVGSVAELLKLEDASGVADPQRLTAFAKQVAETKDELRALVLRLGREHQRVAGYGASAKGTVLLNYCELGREDLTFIVDETPAKQGLLGPGTLLPIRGPEALQGERIDYALLLAWNHRNEILSKEAAFQEAGGRFIVPLPRLEIV